MSDWRVKQVPDVGRVGGISIHKSSAEESANPEDESEAFIPDVACHNKSAVYPPLFTGTDVTISNFKVC